MAIKKELKINVDTSSAQKDIEEFERTLEGLEMVADKISSAISESFISAMDKVLEHLRDFETELLASQSCDGGSWVDGMLSTLDGVSCALSIVGALSSKEMAALGKSVTDMLVENAGTITGITTAAAEFVAIAAAVIAATALIVENWDGIVEFLTDRIPEAVACTEAVFTDMCETVSQDWDEHGGRLLQAFTDLKDGIMDTFWYIYENIIEPVMDACGEKIAWLWYGHLKPLWDKVVDFLVTIGEVLFASWNDYIKPFIDWIIGVFATAISGAINLIIDAVGIAVAFISDMIGGIVQFLDGLIQFVTGIFTQDWKRAWEGFIKVCKSIGELLAGLVKGGVNLLILAINTAIAAAYAIAGAIVNGLGGIIEKIGNLFGQKWSLSMPTKIPQIPYLAQGAVLPPNRPFMAVLGDQKHGTNIEAPLSTIQEAVALVSEEQTKAILAGFEASVGVQREILEAVLGIRIGDDVIGRAADRYQRKMAVVRGGAL